MEAARQCAKCDEHAAGAGGILCPACLTLLEQQAQTYWRDHRLDPQRPDTVISS